MALDSEQKRVMDKTYNAEYHKHPLDADWRTPALYAAGAALLEYEARKIGAAPRAESQDTEALNHEVQNWMNRCEELQDTVPRAVAAGLLRAVKVSRNSQSRRDHTSCHSIPQVVLGSTTLTDFDNRCDQCKQADAAIARAKEAGLE